MISVIILKSEKRVTLQLQKNMGGTATSADPDAVTFVSVNIVLTVKNRFSTVNNEFMHQSM